MKIWSLIKVKAFAWLVVNKVNNNGMLQMRRSYKALTLDYCMENQLIISLNIAYWHWSYGIDYLG